MRRTVFSDNSSPTPVSETRLNRAQFRVRPEDGVAKRIERDVFRPQERLIVQHTTLAAIQTRRLNLRRQTALDPHQSSTHKKIEPLT